MGLLHFGRGWLPEKNECPPRQRDVSPTRCELRVFCSTCLSPLGSSAPQQPHQQWDTFPPLPPLADGPTHPFFPGCHLLALAPANQRALQSLQRETAARAASKAAVRAEQEVSRVLNPGRSKAGRACCSMPFNIWCGEALCLGDLLSAAAACAVCCRIRRWSPERTRSEHTSPEQRV